MEDRAKLIRCIAMHFVVYSQKAEFDDIRQGLEDVLKFGSIIGKHAELLLPLFVSSGRAKLNATSFFSLFEIEYSPLGSNSREREEGVILFNYYIEELEGTVC